tara:strand:+ start:335 stop:901 length:567 start_codon:yes stop_codon:yes gene_type:complete
MLEVNKTHEEFSNVSEDNKKKPEKPENTEKKRRGEGFGAMPQGGMLDPAFFEKMWNELRLNMFLSWANFHNFFLACFWGFVLLQAYKIFRIFLWGIFGRRYVFFEKWPEYFPLSFFCHSPSKEMEQMLLKSDKLPPTVVPPTVLGDTLQKVLKPTVDAKVVGDGGPPSKTPATVVFGALKKKRISLKR